MSENNIHFELNNMLAGPPAEVTPYVTYRSEDGVLAAYGTTVPSTADVYAVGCKFLKVDGTNGNVLYLNVGTKAVPDFKAVLSVGNDATAAGAGPSPLIWDDADLLSILLDPTQGVSYFEDYMGTIDVTTADGYVITAVTSGTIHGDAVADGGVLVCDSAGNATADDGVNVQLPNCTILPLAGRTIRFEARVKVVDAGDDQYYIGLAAADTTLIAAGILDNVVDKAGFFRFAASTADKISVVNSRGAGGTVGTDIADLADDTWVKLGIVIDGLTSVKYYVNGVLVSTTTVTAEIPNAVMALSYVAQVEQTSADAELRVDWVRILQTGARTA